MDQDRPSLFTVRANYWLGVDRRNVHGETEALMLNYPGMGNYHHKTAYLQGIRDAEAQRAYRPYQP